MSHTITPLRPEHYDAVMALWKDAGLSSLRPQGRDSRERVVREMKENPDLFLGAFENGTLIGVCVGTDDGRKGWLNRLTVHPEHRRKGVARQLARATEEALKERGRRIIGILIEDWNAESLELFQDEGYVLHKDIFYLSKREGKEV